MLLSPDSDSAGSGYVMMACGFLSERAVRVVSG
jgi:hypothetical protein